MADEPKHEYPSKYGKGTHWATDEAWDILDALKPGLISTEVRAFLAGQIAGKLMRERALATWRRPSCDKPELDASDE